ncbi:MAG: ABC transporter substrate-binding protein [Acidimicrobiaceae bacterium]|nr:ABC transporter substrate-binding protein [Acidimicrobiaceae bacterium]
MNRLLNAAKGEPSVRLPRKIGTLGALMLSAALILGACGADDDTQTAASPAAESDSAPAPAEPAESADPEEAVAVTTEAPAPAETDEAEGDGESDSMTAASDDSAAATEAEQPVATGGLLRVGSGGFPGGQFNPFFPGSWAEGIALSAVYDRFAWHDRSDLVLSLAESVIPNDDATEWTITLKDAEFHDGSPVTAQDAAYSLSGFSNPQVAPTWAGFFRNVDAANIRIVDDKTLVVPLHSPQGNFVGGTLVHALVVPDGSTGGPDAIGSGAFRLEAFDDGKSIRMSRFENFHAGAPPLDGLEVIFLADPTARLNALKGGEIEVATQITPAAALAESDNPNFMLVPNDVANSITHSFVANTSIAPYDNPDVVRALKLAVDRQDLIDKILLGFGQVGNDLIGKGHPGYDTSIPQIERDVEEARRLFASAGVTELTLMTSEFTAGATAAAELMVQYLADAGVTLTLDVVPPDQWYGDPAAARSRPLQSSWGTNFPPLTFAEMATGPRAGQNLTAIGGPIYDPMILEVIEEADPERRFELGLEIQKYLHENDGRIVWGFQDELSAAIPGVSGVTYNSSIPLFHRAQWER